MSEGVTKVFVRFACSWDYDWHEEVTGVYVTIEAAKAPEEDWVNRAQNGREREWERGRLNQSGSDPTDIIREYEVQS